MNKRKKIEETKSELAKYVRFLLGHDKKKPKLDPYLKLWLRLIGHDAQVKKRKGLIK